MKIVLIGPMAAGKSSVAPIIANRLRIPCYDTDELIVKDSGQSIISLFNTHGETYFRSLESQAIAKLQMLPTAVIATGGGSIMAPSFALLLKDALVVYLQLSIDMQIKRLANVENRPLLPATEYARRNKLTELQQHRQGYYHKYANFCIDTADMSLAAVAATILAKCESTVW